MTDAKDWITAQPPVSEQTETPVEDGKPVEPVPLEPGNIASHAGKAAVLAMPNFIPGYDAEDMAMNMARTVWMAMAKALNETSESTQPHTHGDVERGPWKCFHCGETFTERHCAFEHFGADERRDPACIVAARPGGLLEAYRQAESDALRYQSAMHEESADAIRAMMGMEGRIAKVVRDAEEQGYARGLEDARAEAVSAWGDGAVDSVKAAIDATLVIVSEGPQDDGIANLEDVARAALSAMRPAVDPVKLGEIRERHERMARLLRGGASHHGTIGTLMADREWLLSVIEGGNDDD